MITLIVCIKDQAIETFKPPFTVRARGEAIRAFQNAVNDQQNQELHTHAQQFDIWHIANFDDQTAKITPLEQPEKLANGATLLLPKPPTTLDTTAITTAIQHTQNQIASLGQMLANLNTRAQLIETNTQPQTKKPRTKGRK